MLAGVLTTGDVGLSGPVDGSIDEEGIGAPSDTGKSGIMCRPVSTYECVASGSTLGGTY